MFKSFSSCLRPIPFMIFIAILAGTKLIGKS
jgi:hypothetical protein